MVSPDTRAFTQQDGAMLSALGDYAAIAIENTRIYAALEEATSREKELLRTAFERYVAPTVVDRIVQNPGVMMQLGGKRQTISVLFADVRGFTSYAEQANPEEVVKLLNEYFTLATEIIFTREGTLDKFQGDAVMAIFNAPEEQANHAYRAVDAAMALQRAITERNARIGGEGLTFGIGVHLGDAVVGNIGTTRAMNYTAIGDTVNVAKRLQERAAPGEVLITEDVCTALGDRVEAQVVGDLNMKGRQQVVRVYRLLSLT
jgi:adenylate cyclase